MNDNNRPQSKLLDVHGAAAILGVSAQMVRVAARAGKIPAYHPFAGCSKYVFKEEELKASLISAEEV